MVFTKEAYGYWFPRVSIADVDRNEEQTLRGQGSTVTYHLELRNPFTRGGEVYLVGTMSAMPFRVLLPMDPPSGYAEPDLPSDWVTLSPTMRPDVFSARVTVDPATTHTFLVDLRERKAVKVP